MDYQDIMQGALINGIDCMSEKFGKMKKTTKAVFSEQNTMFHNKFEEDEEKEEDDFNITPLDSFYERDNNILVSSWINDLGYP